MQAETPFLRDEDRTASRSGLDCPHRDGHSPACDFHGVHCASKTISISIQGIQEHTDFMAYMTVESVNHLMERFIL